MTLLVYVTDECHDAARRHALSDIVNRLRVSIEETQSLSQFDHFPPPYIVKKKLGGRQGRLVAEVRRIGDHMVAVLLTVMIRGSGEYASFSHDPVGYGEHSFKGLVNDEALEAYVKDRTKLGEAPGKPPPSDAEFELLYGTFTHAGLGVSDESADADQLDRIVCESHSWVQQVSEPKIRAQLNRLSQACLRALSSEEGLHYWESAEKQGWGVWSYRRDGYVLLLQVVDGSATSSQESEARRIAAELDCSGVDALLQESRRAYPAIVLADEQLWLDLEVEQLANMALSPEETEVLDSTRRSESPFPLFINGRAGSGKSTILQYLFADILFSYGTKIGRHAGSEVDAPGSPLYLTANGELLRNARQFVQRLLTSEVQFSGSESGVGKLDSERLHVLLGESFQEFQPFMLSLVPREQRARFQQAKRIDYPRFRHLWEQRFGKDPRARRDHGPDVAWHVIRSYIKGMGSDEYLGPDDYEQLPENQITVSLETFATVHEQVWSRWYATMSDEGYWDDQDLARFILDNDLAPRSHCAVFCDEAQDFTRIELEVLLRLSLYSNRALPSEAVSRVPFAFAGDEFQTLNPTGFRWDSVKASFVEKFIYELDPARRNEKADLNYRELRYNYRSSVPIVRFCNLVQALRSAMFGITELAPQRAWSRQQSAAPVLFFKAVDAAFWRVFREQAAGYIVIVPCNEGEESAFVASDAILRENVEVIDGVPRNVLSASRAKGCEYPAVVVYGFGEASEGDLMASLGQSAGQTLDPRQSLAIQYFINRLYVAVSRPKARLIVVDSEGGVDRLWKAGLDEFARDRLLGSLKRGNDVWEPEVRGMTPGKPEDLSSDTVPDRLENAKTFEQDGRARRDAYLMMQAASAYRDGGDAAKWRECRAWALDYEGRALEAGGAFAEAGMLDDARRCLWRAEKPGWLKLLELANSHADLLSHIEVQWSSAIQRKPDVRTASDVLERFLQRATNDPKFAQATFGEPIWQLATEALLDRLIDPAGVSVPAAVAAGTLQTLDRLAQYGIKVQHQLVADFSFAAEEYSRAVAALEALGDRRSQRYLLAKSRATPYPGCLEYLGRLGDLDGIARAFREHPTVDLDGTSAAFVSKALIEIGQLDSAIELAVSASDGHSALAVALAARRSNDRALASRGLRQAFELFVMRGEWQPVLQLISNGELGASDEWKEKSIRAWVKESWPDLRVVLIRALARSERLPQASAKQEQVISKFLRDFLRVKDGNWHSKISYLEAGAALERAGRITDTLQFYEAVLGEPLGGEELTEIRLRWIAVKFRQIEYERGRPKVDSNQVMRLEAEIQTQVNSWHMQRPASAPPQYPQLPPLDVVAEPEQQKLPLQLTPIAGAVAAVDRQQGAMASPVYLQHPNAAPAASKTKATAHAVQVADETIEVGGLRIEVKRDRGVCLVTHLESMDTARIEWSKPRVVGTSEIAQAAENTWQIVAWNLKVTLPGEGDAAARLTLASSRIELTILR